MDEAERRLLELGLHELGPALTCDLLVQMGKPYREIVNTAKALSADLIVMPTRGYRRIRRTLKHSTAELVVRLAPCPVLVIGASEPDFSDRRPGSIPPLPQSGTECYGEPPCENKTQRLTNSQGIAMSFKPVTPRSIRRMRALQPRTTMRLTKLLVAIDFSAESKNALRYAGAFSRQFGACLTLLHVVEPVVCAADFGYGPVTRRYPNQELLKKAKTRLNMLGKRLTPSSLRVATVVRTGVAETEIVEAARELETDWIVMGTHGDCRSGQTPIGSTAERVVRLAPCPVFVVRKKEHEFVWCRKTR